VSGERLARVLVRLATDAAARGTTVSSETACETGVHVTGVSGAQLTLTSGTGRGESRYSTNEIGQRLEDLRFVLGEGPSEDALRSGVPLLVPDLDSPENFLRWPLFALAAGSTGARALFALPLRSGAIRLGVFVLHRTSAGPLTLEQVSDAQVLTDIVMSLVLDELAGIHPDPGVTAVDTMPFDQAEVHQATGMLSVQMGVTMDEALVRLRAHAFVHDQRAVDVARAIVGRRLRLSPDGRPETR
jgi:hypothetical protein